MEDFTKTLNSIGQDAIKSAKKLKDLAVLNIDIATAENKRKNYFEALGKLYYEKYAEQAQGEFKELCELIQHTDKTIEQIKSELAKTKGLKKCSSCKKQIKSYSVFCPYCGNEVNDNDDEQKADSDKCPMCGEKAAAGAVYCCVCGKKLN